MTTALLSVAAGLAYLLVARVRRRHAEEAAQAQREAPPYVEVLHNGRRALKLTRDTDTAELETWMIDVNGPAVQRLAFDVIPNGFELKNVHRPGGAFVKERRPRAELTPNQRKRLRRASAR